MRQRRRVVHEASEHRFEAIASQPKPFRAKNGAQKSHEVSCSATTGNALVTVPDATSRGKLRERLCATSRSGPWPALELVPGSRTVACAVRPSRHDALREENA
jgi:hypothetical protein